MGLQRRGTVGLWDHGTYVRVPWVPVVTVFFCLGSKCPRLSQQRNSNKLVAQLLQTSKKLRLSSGTSGGTTQKKRCGAVSKESPIPQHGNKGANSRKMGKAFKSLQYLKMGIGRFAHGLQRKSMTICLQGGSHNKLDGLANLLTKKAKTSGRGHSKTHKSN